MLSHGNGFAIDGYFNFWSRFLGDFDVVVFDMRSHGRNPRAEPPCAIGPAGRGILTPAAASRSQVW